MITTDFFLEESLVLNWVWERVKVPGTADTSYKIVLVPGTDYASYKIVLLPGTANASYKMV